MIAVCLQAAASAATEATALAVCQRVSTSTNNVWGSLHAEEVAELVSACTPALSSRTVAEDVLSTVEHICFRSYAGTRAVCGGAIDLVVAAMAAHGAASVNIAATGCSALWNLAYQTGSTANADVIVLSAGGVGAITAVMEVHAENERVQKAACRALWRITSDASPAARDRIQHGLAPKLIHTAMSNHSSSGYNTVKYWADLALTALTG